MDPSSGDLDLISDRQIIDSFPNGVSDQLLVVVGGRYPRNRQASIVKMNLKTTDAPSCFCKNRLLDLQKEIGQFRG